MKDLITGLAVTTSRLIEQAFQYVVMIHDGHHRTGTGIIWRKDHHGSSFIITNNHIVAHNRNLRISSGQNDECSAKLVAFDPEIDLALLRIKSTTIPAARIADTDKLRIGELVFAIGNPWGQRNVVTVGLISSFEKLRTSSRSPREIDVIRSDARLAPGNSGGPLINSNGDVLGVSTMIIGSDQGIAISTNLVNAFIQEALSGWDRES